MKSSILDELHRAAGATFSRGASPEPLYFIDVPEEYRRAAQGAGLFDQTNRGLVAAEGAEAQTFLHRVLANEVRGLAPGAGNLNLFLDAKGKVRFQFALAVTPSAIELSTEVGQATALIQALEMYHFSEKLTLKDCTERHAPLALAGPRAFELAARVLGEFAPPQLGSFVELRFDARLVRAARIDTAGSDGLRLDGGPELAPSLWRALVEAGAQQVGRVVYDSLRVEAGVTDARLDVDAGIYPQEARLERAFSLDKGCYIGQEVVAKIDTYGGLNKRLVALAVGDDEPVARGARLLREDQGEWRDLGIATSWAYSFALDRGLVLAYVKRRHQKPGTEFRIDEGPRTATIVELPVRAGALRPTGEFE